MRVIEGHLELQGVEAQVSKTLSQVTACLADVGQLVLSQRLDPICAGTLGQHPEAIRVWAEWHPEIPFQIAPRLGKTLHLSPATIAACSLRSTSRILSESHLK